MKRVFSLLLLLALGISTLMGQARTVTGTVTSAEDGSPVPGVSVMVEGTSFGTITSAIGEYSIDLSEGNEVLIFSFVGMASQSITVNGRTIIDVILEPDVLLIDEVVVTALGISREKKHLDML